MDSKNQPKRHFPDLDTPALLIEQTIVERNIARMQQLADTHHLALRPHIKTHKIPELARWQLDAGACGLAVAKLGEAEVMAAAGCRDIQVANQIVGGSKIARLFALSDHTRVSCAVDSTVNVEQLGKFFHVRNRTLPVLIELDCGLHRSGLESPDAVVALAEHIKATPGVHLEGLMTHAGHAYAATDAAELAAIGRYEADFTLRMADALRDVGLPVSTLSVGSTPTARHAGAVKGITELRVGNYVFNDRMQTALGVCEPADCALSILSTVISVPSATRAILDAGSKAFALDTGAHGIRRLEGYGKVMDNGPIVSRLSEEHGIIEHATARYEVGQKLRILPNHACTAVNLFDRAYLVDGDTIVTEFTIAARGRMA